MPTPTHFRVGRILLHLLAMLGDRCVRFHVAGILRELPSVSAALTEIGGRQLTAIATSESRARRMQMPIFGTEQ
jgi:hypothetical protein